MTDNTTPQWNTPAGWTDEGLGLGGNGANFTIFTKVSDGTETDVTVTLSVASDLLGWYLRISGADTTTPINISATETSLPSLSFATPTVTSTVDGCLAIYGLSFDGGDGYPFSVSGTGWAQTAELQAGSAGSQSSGCWGEKEQTTAGATGDATVTSSISDGATYFQLAIAPA